MEKAKFYYIATYGCQMNVHESEKLAGILSSRGFLPTTDQTKADIIVFNTCCIREGAEQKIIGNIGAVKPLKKQKKDLVVAVCGCMTQQSKMATYLKEKFPFINIIFGANNVEFFGKYLDTYLQQKKFQNNVIFDENYIENENGVEISRDSTLHAFVNIMYGCNNFCSYCIVPYVKGREISRDASLVLDEVKQLVQMNYKVVTLLGQNVNSYHSVYEGKEVDFADLMQLVCDIDGDFELRFMSSHPKDLNSKVIDTIARNDKISKYIHLPVQSGSNSVLKRMNRNYTREKYLSLIDEIKAKIPNVVLTTDIIVGFPGETEKDFEDTVDLLKTVGYANAFIFMYSKRKGTPAETMENQVPIETKRQRIHTLLAIEHEISNKIFESMKGTKQRVLIEQETDNEFIAKAQCGKVVKIAKTHADLAIGKFADVEIVDYKNGDLIAKI